MTERRTKETVRERKFKNKRFSDKTKQKNFNRDIEKYSIDWTIAIIIITLLWTHLIKERNKIICTVVLVVQTKKQTRTGETVKPRVIEQVFGCAIE